MRFVAALVLACHAAWILFVMFGAIWTRGRPGLTALHMASLVWGVVVEVGPWPCPATVLEQWLERHGHLQTYTGSFVVHYLDAIIYPNLPVDLIIACGVGVCCINLLVYAVRLVRTLRARQVAA